MTPILWLGAYVLGMVALSGLIVWRLRRRAWYEWRERRRAERARYVYGPEYEIGLKHWPPVPGPLPPAPPAPCYWDAPGPWKRAKCPTTACARHGASPWDCPLPLEVVTDAAV